MLRYIGGSFLPGVPARDLTDEEAERYGVARLIDSGLYILAEDKALRVRRETKAPVVINVQSAAVKLRNQQPSQTKEGE